MNSIQELETPISNYLHSDSDLSSLNEETTAHLQREACFDDPITEPRRKQMENPKVYNTEEQIRSNIFGNCSNNNLQYILWPNQKASTEHLFSETMYPSRELRHMLPKEVSESLSESQDHLHEN